MKVVETSVDLGSLIVSEEQSAKRTPGLHVSSIIKYIAKKSGLRKDNKFTEADLDLFALFGRIWEHHLARTLCQPPRYERIGEIEKDGILCSPDAIDRVDWAVVEFKCPWMGYGKLETFPMWLWQVKAYCHVLEMQRARVIACFINGDYKPPKPLARQYSVVFSPIELATNWEMLKNAAKEMPRE